MYSHTLKKVSLCAFSLFALISCSKDLVYHPLNSIYTIGYSGTVCVGYPVCFVSSPQKASNYLWDFGDGTASTDSSPCHVYSDTGTFKIKLNVNNATDSASFGITIYKAPVLSYLLSGTKTWSRSEVVTYRQPGTNNSTYYFSDTSFAITYINPVSILLGNDTLKYYPYTSNDSILYFEKGNLQLYFNHAADSIYFSAILYNTESEYVVANYYTH